MSVSDYQETEGLPKADRKPYEPWAYDTANAKLYIPRFAPGQDRWFAAALSSQKGKPPSRIAVFAEQPKDNRWEMATVVDLDSRALPAIALNQDGYATAVAADGNNQLAADATLLRVAVLDNFATGGINTGTKVFAPTKASKQQIQVHDETGKQFGDKGTSVFAGGNNPYQDAYALKTTDGGALILFPHPHPDRLRGALRAADHPRQRRPRLAARHPAHLDPLHVRLLRRGHCAGESQLVPPGRLYLRPHRRLRSAGGLRPADARLTRLFPVTLQGAPCPSHAPISSCTTNVERTTEQIHRARTNAENRAFAQTVGGEGHTALGELRQVLETAAELCDRNQQPTIAERYRRQVAQLAELESHLGLLG